MNILPLVRCLRYRVTRVITLHGIPIVYLSTADVVDLPSSSVSGVFMTFDNPRNSLATKQPRLVVAYVVAYQYQAVGNAVEG
jgi:hypothetical protein